MQSTNAEPAIRAATGTILLPERVAALHAIRQLLDVGRDEVLTLLTESATHQAARYELEAAIKALDGAVAEMARTRPPATGALAAFMPSNVLLYSYVLYLLVPSLFTQRLVFRASSSVGPQLTRLHELLAPVHGLPIEQQHASQRTFLTDSVAAADVVVFTGTYQNAEKIRPQLRPEQLFLFFGAGINPFVVLPNADVGLAVRDAAAIRLLNCGQDCLAPDLLFVHDDVFDEFVNRLVSELKGLRYGPYTEPHADYGPIFYEGALEATALYLCRNRRDIVHGGTVDFRNRRLEPAVLVSEFSTRPQYLEFFTPVFNLIRYTDGDALVNLLTGGAFRERALGATVYGSAPDLIARLRERHTVTVNNTLLAIDDGNAPFGGYGPMANYISRCGAIAAKPILVSAAVAEYLDGPR